MYSIFRSQLLYRTDYDDEINEEVLYLEYDENDLIHDGFLLTICLLGIIFNWLSLLVLANKERKLPIFLYLTIYTAMDLLYTIILFGDVLASGYLRYSVLPGTMNLLELFGGEVINTIRIIAVLAITLDRLIHLKNILALRCTGRKNVRRHAVLVMSITFSLTIIGNLPNLLLCLKGDPYSDQNFFLQSRLYSLYSWIYFSVFYIIPCFLMIVGNVFLIILLRRAIRRENIRSRTGRKINFTLTIAATIIIVTFAVIQMPGYLIRRINFVSIVTNVVPESLEILMRNINDVYIFIPAINSFGNFFVYSFLCPPFRKALVKTLKKRRICALRSNSVNQVNVL